MVISSPSERIGGAIGAGVVAAAFLYLLIAGLVVKMTGIGGVRPDLLSFVPPPPPPEVRIETRPKPSHKTEGKAAPPNIVSKATEVTAPEIKPVVPPPPLPAATKPFDGSQSTQGAAPVAGPGTGAGGMGNGTGSGDRGDGDGAGYTPPRQIGGRLRMSDIPDEVRDAGVRGTVGVRFYVTPEGRATDCRVTRRSGSTLLDVTTCRLIEQRFRFRPSLGPDGQPVGSYIVENHYWFTDGDDDR